MKGWRRYERLRTTEQRGTGPRNHENRTNRTAMDRWTEPRNHENGTEHYNQTLQQGYIRLTGRLVGGGW